MAELNFPSSPTDGQTYTSGTTTWTYRTSYGVWDITSSGPTGYTGSKGTTFIGDSPPASPVNGDTWFDSSEGIRYVYYADGTSSQWVQESIVGATGYTGYTGSQGVGFTGSQGVIGYTGSQGAGFTGSQGAGFTGSQGVIGYTGSAVTNVPLSGSAKTSSYTLTTGDVGKYIEVGTSGSIIVPNSTFTAGDVISIFNNTTGNITITLSITTAYISGTNTDKDTVTLATRGLCSILFISGTVCVLSGSVT